jgi:hypothetical protein
MPTIDHLADASRDPVQSLRVDRDAVRVEADADEEDYGFVISTTTAVDLTATVEDGCRHLTRSE